MTNQLLVYNVPFNVSGQGLAEFCSAVIAPAKSEVLVDAVSSRSKGVGLVTFESVTDASRVAHELGGKELFGHALRFEVATPEAMSRLSSS